MDVRRILITGANKGIGRATVRRVLANADDTHVLLGSRSVERGEAARDELTAADPTFEGRIDVVELDVSSDESVEAASDWVKARFGREAGTLYAVDNNAGIGDRDADMRTVLDVNTRGPRRVCQAFLPLLDPDVGRIVNVSSASGPNFVAACSEERQELFTDPDVTWEEIEAVMRECLMIEKSGGDFQSAGFGEGSAYGLSKACLNAYTVALAREHPNLTINSCTPGFIETDMTRRYVEERDVTPEEVGMKQPSDGARTPTYLLLGDVEASGWYFGSDAERSPLDRYRSPGDPPYAGE